MAGYCLDNPDPEKTIPGGGMIAGIGYVVRRALRWWWPTIPASTPAPSSTWAREKLLRAQGLALENKLPFVHLVESAGANLLKYRVEGFIHGGAIFYNLARLSAAGTAGGDRGARLLHRGRRLHAGPVRLRDHGARPRQGLPRRAAAAQGRHRRDRHRRGAGRRRDAHARLGPRRVPRRGRRRRHPPRARSARAPGLASAGARAGRQAAALRRRRTARRDARGLPQARRHARSRSRASWTTPTSSTSRPTTARPRCAATPRCRASRVGIITNNGPLDPAGATKATHFIQACCQAGHAAPLPAEHHRLHRRQGLARRPA